MRPGTKVTYHNWGCTRFGKILANVCRVHRDGTVTVEARFSLDFEGEITGTYLGYRYRLERALLSEVA